MGQLKTIGIVGGVAVFLLSATAVFAQSQTVSNVQGTSTVRTKPIEVRKGVVATTTQKEIRKASEDKMKAAREEAKARMETQREEIKTRIETAREETKARVETIREEAKARMETKREEAKQHLKDVRDKAKQERAERLAEQFDKLNKRWTDHFIQLLDRYEAILLKIQGRADRATTNGKDATATNSSIQLARTAIGSARTAVVAQVGKSYTLDTSTLATATATTTTSGQDELVSSLRVAFQNLHRTLFNDLFALRDGVMRDARAAVQAALRTLSQIPKVDDDVASSTDSSNQ